MDLWFKHIHSVVQPPSPELFSCKTETLQPKLKCTTKTETESYPVLFSPPPFPIDHHFLSDFDFSGYLIQVESCSICRFLTSLFHLA